MHVREDRRNGAGLAVRSGSPGGRVKMFDKNLVDAIIGGKDLDCGSAELSVNLRLTRGHACATFRVEYNSGKDHRLFLSHLTLCHPDRSTTIRLGSLCGAEGPGVCLSHMASFDGIVSKL